MGPVDRLSFNAQLLKRHRVRALLLVLTIAIGVASVVMLTAVGEGARRYVVREFSALGSELLIILPGRIETSGGAPPLYGTTPRDLTLEDAQALSLLSGVVRVAPVLAGTARVSRGARARDVVIIGSTPALFPVRDLRLAQGRGLPAAAANRAQPVCVLGDTLARALFDGASPMYQWVRIGDRRFRVIGVLQTAGEHLGMDLRDMAVIPARSAEQLFDTQSLFRILVQLEGPAQQAAVEARVRALIRERHDGEDDVTLISQDALLATFDRILRMLTLILGAIAAISLVVAGVLIMNLSLISVAQRRAEIGLLKALGASARQVRRLFLDEALLLAALGAGAGLLLGEAAVAVALRLLPQFPFAAPLWADLAAVAVALLCGALFAWWPASQAARLDPVRALRGLA
ncbi:ABC transporter permease [Motiliproteus sp. SC1-56]|uniref:ABC transporter permease n=1 Tax=Motiliproteus sp. SC1-56 TaxID=2799565 RepID=UPI001A8D0CC1|nr:ABC transporter permease [Motiliproteus sp. SC1-56]